MVAAWSLVSFGRITWKKVVASVWDSSSLPTTLGKKQLSRTSWAGGYHGTVGTLAHLGQCISLDPRLCFGEIGWYGKVKGEFARVVKGAGE